MTAYAKSQMELMEKRSETEILAEGDYFMGVGVLTAIRSKNLNTQHGTHSVEKDNDNNKSTYVGVGYCATQM